MGSSFQGVLTSLGISPSIFPIAPGIIYPTQSISLNFAFTLLLNVTITASLGTNLGSVVITVLPVPL